VTGVLGRVAVIGAAGELLQVVFSTDGIDLTDCTTTDCPDEWPDAVEWDVAQQDFVTPPPPPTPPAPALHQLCDMLVASNTITAEQAATIKAA